MNGKGDASATSKLSMNPLHIPRGQATAAQTRAAARFWVVHPRLYDTPPKAASAASPPGARCSAGTQKRALACILARGCASTTTSPVLHITWRLETSSQTHQIPVSQHPAT